MADCDNCKYKMCWEYAEPCSSCTDMTGEPTNWKPQTNADRIRAMTNEELAEWINKHDCYTNLYGHDSKDAILDWLKQEVNNERLH